jgi:hypothetical protein
MRRTANPEESQSPRLPIFIDIAAMDVYRFSLSFSVPREQPMPMHYVVSAHGGVDFNGKTCVPWKTKVLFYQSFGQSISNAVAFAIQSAICNTTSSTQAVLANQVISSNPVRATWQTSGIAKNFDYDIQLTPDTHNPKWFLSGIVRALDNSVIVNIDAVPAGMTLSAALLAASNNASSYDADLTIVHCLFCL